MVQQKILLHVPLIYDQFKIITVCSIQLICFTTLNVVETSNLVKMKNLLYSLYRENFKKPSCHENRNSSLRTEKI